MTRPVTSEGFIDFHRNLHSFSESMVHATSRSFNGVRPRGAITASLSTSLAFRSRNARHLNPPLTMKRKSKKLHLLVAALATALAVASTPLQAQSVSSLTTGLLAPTKIAFSTKGNLLVAESGIGHNTGRISLIDPLSGSRRTLLDGLPSGLSIPANDPSGPSGLVMQGRTLYVTIGLGDAVVNGPAPGTQVPNPAPTSPIFSSVLAIHFSANAEKTTAGFSLTLANHVALKNGATVSLDNGAGDKLTIELVADFPNYTPEPTPAVPANVRQSNPFGIALVGDQLYISDASGNIVRKVDIDSGAMSTFSTFAPLPNTRGFGPPMVEAVPDSIRVFNGQLLVTLLSGFPFPIGQAQVRTVSLADGTNAPFITGLTSAIDVLPANGGFYTLEFSADQLSVAALGRIKFFASPTATPVVVTAALVTPTSMVRDEKTGALFVTSIATGQVMKMSP